MKKAELDCTCFDIDNDTTHFPFRDKSFDAVIALATIEHVINVDRFVTELGRVLSDDGFLYISAPSYSGLFYVLPLMLNGKTFHDPMKQESKYEFYAHVRYFTYETLLEYVSSFGFTPDTVYLALPEASSKFVEMKKRSKAKAWLFRLGMSGIYRALGARWASEPVICFRKGSGGGRSQVRKVIL
jgi:SAM-dependent methyltransferase